MHNKFSFFELSDGTTFEFPIEITVRAFWLYLELNAPEYVGCRIVRFSKPETVGQQEEVPENAVV